MGRSLLVLKFRPVLKKCFFLIGAMAVLAFSLFVFPTGAQAADNASCASWNPPASVIAGQPFTLTVTMQNNGTTVWQSATQYKLGSYDSSFWPWTTIWSPGRWEMPVASVNPGSAVTFSNISVTAPSTPGTYTNFGFKMLQENVRWFGAACGPATVTVTASTPTPTPTPTPTSLPSDWKESSSWKTPKHSYPLVDFTWSPSEPAAKQQAQFTDLTTFYDTGGTGQRAWSWLFKAPSPSPSSALQNPAYTYDSAGFYQVQETVTDKDGYTCPSTKQINISLPIPVWKEVSPR